MTRQHDAAELLDARLPALQTAAGALKDRPHGGWIYALRTALGLSTAALAKLLNVSQPTVFKYEKGEVNGTITLETLGRVAAALDADLVVAIVPRKPIALTLRARAETLAREEMGAVVRTMQLEAQAVDEAQTRKDQERLVDALLTKPKKLWT
jgi:predicted DNA-binding mobile mystery protein A